MAAKIITTTVTTRVKLRFAGDLQFVLYGLMLMVVVIFMPRGVIGIVDRFKTLRLVGHRPAPLGN